MDIGQIGIWSGAFDAHPTSAVISAYRQLESLGYRAIWLPEAVGRDPFVAATIGLSATERIVFATGIANIYARDAMTMAACQKTIAEAFPGRFLLGMGVSHHHLVERLRKHDYSRPYSYMRQYLDEMDSALFMAKLPSEDPGRVLAALGPKMLELAAAKASGAHPYLTTPEHTVRAREIMGENALLAPEQMVVLETDPEKARRIARTMLTVYLRAPNYLRNLERLGFESADFEDPASPSNRLVDAIVAWGTVDQIVARVNEHFQAGANHVCIQVLRGDMDLPLGEWRELASAFFGKP